MLIIGIYDGDLKEAAKGELENALKGVVEPLTRARAKRIKEAMNWEGGYHIDEEGARCRGGG